MIRPHWSGPPFGVAFEPGGRIDVEEESPARGDRGQAAAGGCASLAGRERRGGHSGDRRHGGGCGTNCSTARSSTACGRRRSSSRVGGVTPTRCGRTGRWATDRPRRRCSCPPSPLGPPSQPADPWWSSPPCTTVYYVLIQSRAAAIRKNEANFARRRPRTMGGGCTVPNRGRVARDAACRACRRPWCSSKA